MYSWQTFDEVFGFDSGSAYGLTDAQTIQSNRKALEGLFVDKVLRLMGIKRREQQPDYLFNFY